MRRLSSWKSYFCGAAAIAASVLFHAHISLAADYNHGDACTDAGAFHSTNDASTTDFLICNGSVWKSAVTFAAAGNNLRIDNDPAAGSAGCIQYNGGTSKLQFSHDCSSYTDLSGGGTSFWTSGTADDIYYNTGTPQVGIGLTDPAYSLDVSGSVRVSSQVIITSTAGAAAPTFFSLDSLSDVATGGAADGNVLTYNAGSWAPAAGGGGLSFPLIANPVGSASAPAYSFSSDTNTGMYAATADKLSLATAGTERIRVTATGMSINQAADPSVALDITGDIEYSGVITDVSDRRLKENIAALPDSLKGILALQGYSFTMKDDKRGAVEYGLMAQDVQPVFPALVKTGADGMMSLNYTGLIAPLIEAVKEQQKAIDDLTAKNAALEARLVALEARLGAPAKEENGEQ